MRHVPWDQHRTSLDAVVDGIYVRLGSAPPRIVPRRMGGPGLMPGMPGGPGLAGPGMGPGPGHPGATFGAPIGPGGGTGGFGMMGPGVGYPPRGGGGGPPGYPATPDPTAASNPFGTTLTAGGLPGAGPAATPATSRPGARGPGSGMPVTTGTPGGGGGGGAGGSGMGGGGMGGGGGGGGIGGMGGPASSRGGPAEVPVPAQPAEFPGMRNDLLEEADWFSILLESESDRRAVVYSVPGLDELRRDVHALVASTHELAVRLVDERRNPAGTVARLEAMDPELRGKEEFVTNREQELRALLARRDALLAASSDLDLDARTSTAVEVLNRESQDCRRRLVDGEGLPRLGAGPDLERRRAIEQLVGRFVEARTVFHIAASKRAILESSNLLTEDGEVPLRRIHGPSHHLPSTPVTTGLFGTSHPSFPATSATSAGVGYGSGLGPTAPATTMMMMMMTPTTATTTATTMTASPASSLGFGAASGATAGGAGGPGYGAGAGAGAGPGAGPGPGPGPGYGANPLGTSLSYAPSRTAGAGAMPPSFGPGPGTGAYPGMPVMLGGAPGMGHGMMGPGYPTPGLSAGGPPPPVYPGGMGGPSLGMRGAPVPTLPGRP